MRARRRSSGGRLRPLGGALALATLLWLAACAGDTVAPGTPKGLSTVPGNGEVLVAWDANSEDDLAGYNVYQGTDPDALTVVAEVAAGSESYVAAGLTNGTVHYFALDAEDAAGNRSNRTPVLAETPELVASGGLGSWDVSNWDDAVWGP